MLIYVQLVGDLDACTLTYVSFPLHFLCGQGAHRKEPSMAQSTTGTTPVIRIHKAPGAKKDAVRINGWGDIPEFLYGIVAIDTSSNEIVIGCLEVEKGQRCPLGSVVAYEPSFETGTGWNAWCKADWAETLVEIDGEFYEKSGDEKPPVLLAQELTDEFPELIRGAEVERGEDGRWLITTNWGVSKGYPGKAYAVLYGMKEVKDEEGTVIGTVPDANILTKTERSFRQYIDCDEEGNDICSLPEWDARIHA